MRYEPVERFYVGDDGEERPFWRFALVRPRPEHRAMASRLDDAVTDQTIRAYAAWRVVERGVSHVRWSVLGVDDKRRDFDTVSDVETWLDGLNYGFVVRDVLRGPA